MKRGIRVRIYPNKSQREDLAKNFGCSRFVWNEGLAHRIQTYKNEGKSLSYFDMCKRLTEVKKSFPWLKETSAQMLQQVLKNQQQAFSNFFSGKSKYPKYKKKSGTQSIRYPQNINVVDGKYVIIPKLGKIKAKIHRPINGQIKSITISQVASGKYFASILVDDGKALPKKLKSLKKIVGVDLGLTYYVTLSTGEKVENPRFLKKAQRNLRRKQKTFARKQRGTKRREKARLLLASAHERVANARQDFQHKLANTLANENQVVGVETLSIRNLMKNRCLSRAISDAGWYNFIEKLEYKLNEKGKHLVKMDRFFASSKTCHKCGTKKEDLTLKTRYWTCSVCLEVHDRDINAAINIRKQSILKLQADGLSVSAR